MKRDGSERVSITLTLRELLAVHVALKAQVDTIYDILAEPDIDILEIPQITKESTQFESALKEVDRILVRNKIDLLDT